MAIATLYRNPWRPVILAGLAFALAQSAPAQFAKRPAVSKGPRALGLVELAANGKAHLVPVAIMIDGEFYDASAYKASPVPMALESHTVYEAFRAGVSQGMFTVTGALQKPGSWLGEGTWLAAGQVAASKGRQAETKPRDDEEPKPPVLRHADSEPSKAGQSSGSAATPVATTPSSVPASTGSDDSDRPVLHRPQSEPQTAPAPTADDDPDRPVLHKAQPEPQAQTPPASPAPVASAPAPTPVPENDPDQPALRRGKPSPKPAEKPASQTVAGSKAPAAGSPATTGTKVAAATVQTIPAISDAGGPEARPYAYALKTGEEEQFRKKMLALAAGEIAARASQLAPEKVGAPSAHSAARSGKAGRPTPPQPDFEDVKLQIFDLSNSNEPVLVLTAKARLPRRRNDTTPDLQYMVALVAREDIYGDLHKAFSNLTDTQHLDVVPIMEFIDAVDADGDGRGELLFRQTSDAGSAFVIYRVIGNQLWALFQGTPQ